MDIRSENDYCILCACEHKNIDVLKYLIKNGLDVQAYENECLKEASKTGNLEIVKYLIGKVLILKVESFDALFFFLNNFTVV